jgi:putative ABC transport system ATP-binding protein
MPAAQLPSTLSPGTLSLLAAITGTPFDRDRAHAALEHTRADPDPLSQLVSAAKEVSITIHPVRLPLSEALWLAKEGSAVTLWSASEGCWLVVTSADWFSVRVARGNTPNERTTLSRSVLSQRVGVSSSSALVEAGIVHPSSPGQAARSAPASQPGQTGLQTPAADSFGGKELSPERRLFNFLELERGQILTLLIFSLFSGLLYLGAPLAIDAVVSNLSFGGRTQPYVQALVILSAALLGCISLQALISGFQYYISEVIQRRIFVRTAAEIAHRLPRVKAEAVDRVHAPELVNRFLEVVTAQKSTSLLLLDGVNVVFGSLTGMLLLAFYHPALLALVVILSALMCLVIWPVGRGAVKTSIHESKMKYELVHWFEQIAAFPYLFRGPGGQRLASENANYLSSLYLEKRISHFKIVLQQISGLLVLSACASAAVLFLGGWLVLNQQLTIGQLAASELIMGGIAASLAKLGKKLEAWYDLMAAMDKLGNLLDLETERETGERPARSDSGMSIEARNLSFVLPGIPSVVTDRTFTVPSGSHTAVVGPYGSGCSTLLDLFFGLRTPTSGHLSIDGLDIRNWYLEALREDVLLLRGFEIVPGSVIQNLRLGTRTIGLDEIRSTLAAVGLLESILRHPEGLNLELQSGGAPLSGNEKLRLLLARAIVQKPRLLLIDELIDGVDEASLTVFKQAILSSSLPWTVVVASRDPAVTSLFQQIIPLGANFPTPKAPR